MWPIPSFHIEDWSHRISRSTVSKASYNIIAQFNTAAMGQEWLLTLLYTAVLADEFEFRRALRAFVARDNTELSI